MTEQTTIPAYSDTIVALATPAGIGAIGVIRLSGTKAIEIAASVFKGKNLLTQNSHTIHFGTVADEGQLIDEVLVSIFIAPKSYTRENVVEISCHGSSFIIEKIIKLFIKKGVRAAEPGEFTLRAFVNGQLDLSQAEAVADLIASDSEAAHQVAINQLRGGFSNDLAMLREQLINFASLIELELDFAEEDVEFADRTNLEALINKIIVVIKQLLDSFGLGNVIKKGVNTVIAGRPNAGKSTLLNALLNEDRAIVSEIAGTTRDTIEEVFNIKGINFRFIDTAGIREATDTIEAIGVDKTFQKIEQSALLIYLFDATTISQQELDKDIAQLYNPKNSFLAVANKADLPNAKKLTDFIFPDNVKTIAISAKEKLEIEPLKAMIYGAAIGNKLNDNQTMVTNIRHYEALKNTFESLQKVKEQLNNPITSDFLAADIKEALYYLGLITGQVTTDDLLANIFSKFCIGK